MIGGGGITTVVVGRRYVRMVMTCSRLNANLYGCQSRSRSALQGNVKLFPVLVRAREVGPARRVRSFRPASARSSSLSTPRVNGGTGIYFYVHTESSFGQTLSFPPPLSGGCSEGLLDVFRLFFEPYSIRLGSAISGDHTYACHSTVSLEIVLHNLRRAYTMISSKSLPLASISPSLYG